MTADGMKLSVSKENHQIQPLPHFDTFLQESSHRSRLLTKCHLSSDTNLAPWTSETVSIRCSDSTKCGKSSIISPEFKTSQFSNTANNWTSYCSVPPININISWCSDVRDSESTEPSTYNGTETNMPPGSDQATYETLLAPMQAIKSSACLTSAVPNSSVTYSGNCVSRTSKRTENFDLNTIIRNSPTSLVGYVNGSRGSSVETQGGGGGGSYGHLSVRKSGHHQCVPLNIPELTDCHNVYLNKQNVNEDFAQYSASTETSSSNDTDVNASECQNLKYLEDFHLTDNTNSFQNHIVMPQNLLQQYEQDLFISGTSTIPDSYDIKSVYQISDNVVSRCSEYVSETPSVSEYIAYDLNDDELLQSFDGMPEFDTCGTAATLISEDEVFVTDPPIVHQNNRTSPPHDNICKWIDCSAVCLDRDELVRHIEKSHIDQRKGDDFTCFWQGCPRRHRAFNARYKLLIHMRVHSGEKPNKCTFKSCGKAFSRLENLKIHLRSHTGERPYHCQYTTCTKAFSNSSDRAKHQRTHLDTKPYACQISGCTKRYTDPSSLRKHVKNHGSTEQQAKKRVRGNKGVTVTVGPPKPLKKKDQHQIPDIHSGLTRLNSTGCSGSESYSSSSHDGGSPRLWNQISTEDDQSWNNFNPCVFYPTNDIFDMELAEPPQPQTTLNLTESSAFEIGPIDFEYRNYPNDRCFELDSFLNYNVDDYDDDDDDDDKYFEEFINSSI